MSNGGDPRLNLWAIILMSGCGLMFVAFFMPWWGLTEKETKDSKPPAFGETEKRKAYEEEIKALKEKRTKTARVFSKNKTWYKNKIGDDRYKAHAELLDEKLKDAEPGATVSQTVRLWGWNTGVGITALILAIVLLPVAIVPMFVRMLRTWIWIGYFVAAVAGLVLFILSLVWYFVSPGENAAFLVQGVGWYPGPYMMILGSLGTLVTGVLGGVFGLLAFLKGLKTPGSAPRTATKRDVPVIEDDEF